MKRVLLKLSGEALAGDKKTGFDEPTVTAVAHQVKELVDEIDINRSTFYLHYTDIYQMLQSIEGELMEDILEAIKEHPLDPGMKEEGYSFAIQLFRILAANKDICAALMGPNGDMAFVEKIEKLVEDAVLPELLRCSHRMSTTSNTPTLSASTAAWE